MASGLEVSPETMSVYRATAQQREEREKQARSKRRERAWQVAQQAAALLKEEFGVTQVILFGSLVHGHWFSLTSDVDLAVWGLKKEATFFATARLQDLSPDFKVDLVVMENCRADLRQTIMKEGKLL